MESKELEVCESDGVFGAFVYVDRSEAAYAQLRFCFQSLRRGLG